MPASDTRNGPPQEAPLPVDPKPGATPAEVPQPTEPGSEPPGPEMPEVKDPTADTELDPFEEGNFPV